jgi:hypothetical protein
MTLEDATQTIGRPKTHGDKSGPKADKAGRPATLRISVFKRITPHSALLRRAGALQRTTQSPDTVSYCSTAAGFDAANWPTLT